MPVLGIDLALNLGIELGIDLAGGGGPAPPVLEAPELIPDLGAWYDSRTDDYFALGGAGEVTTWLSRAGSMGGVPYAQGVAGNQPVRDLAVALMGGKNAVRFDGVDDFLASLVAADWTFLHDNTGGTIFVVERVDSTGPVDQLSLYNITSASQRGFRHLLRLASFSPNVGNGSSTYQNSWTNSTAGHFARNVSRWRAWAYGNSEQLSAVSGSTTTSPDTVGQVPSALAPTLSARFSNASTVAFKGYFAQVMFYKRVLTAPELASLGAWAATEYGVAA